MTEIKTTRENFFDVLKEKNKIDNFFVTLDKEMQRKDTVRLPIQLLENIFEFDFHRKENIAHPIKQSIVSEFKDHGYLIRKVRNKYLVKITKK